MENSELKPKTVNTQQTEQLGQKDRHKQPTKQQKLDMIANTRKTKPQKDRTNNAKQNKVQESIFPKINTETQTLNNKQQTGQIGQKDRQTTTEAKHGCKHKENQTIKNMNHQCRPKQSAKEYTSQTVLKHKP